MRDFIYKIKDDNGKSFTGVLAAESPKALRKKLRKAGYYIVGVSVYRGRSKGSVFEARITLDVLIMFTQELSSMIEAGLPILTALDILWKEMNNPKMQVVISQIKNKLNEGSSISEAIDEFPLVFPIMYRALFAVAESGGGLIPILRKLKEYLKNQKEFINKVKKATTYPIIVVIFALIVVVAMLSFLVPIFQRVFSRIKAELPLVTRITIKLSDLLRSPVFWLITGGVIFLVYFFYKGIKANPKGNLYIDRLKLKLPVVGKVIHIASVGRFVRCLSLLLGGGLTATKSIEVAKSTTTNKHIEQALGSVQKQIVEGISLSEALRKTKAFPNILVEMISVGEQSGTLVEMLNKVADNLEERLDLHLSKFLSLLEPILIIFVGGLVAFILISIYLPLFGLMKGFG